MKSDSMNSIWADYLRISRHACPLCTGPLIRARRSMADRLIGLFVPAYRYRCRRFNCQWEGTIRTESRTANDRSAMPEQRDAQ